VSEPSAAELLRELATLANGLASTAAPAGLAKAPQAVTAVAQRFFGAAACSIAELDDDADELVYVAASGAGADAIIDVRLPIGRGVAGWVAQSGQPIAISDLSRDVRFARDVAESTSYVPTALLAVPIEAGDRLLGVLSVLDRDETRRDAAQDLESATLFAGQAAVALQARAASAPPGGQLLGGLAHAAASGSPLAAAMSAHDPGPLNDPDLAAFAAALAAFRRCNPAERAFGLQLVRDVLAFVNRGGGGRSSASR
jgi:signal transduction protein with GAF and PtsI domain